MHRHSRHTHRHTHRHITHTWSPFTARGADSIISWAATGQAPILLIIHIQSLIVDIVVMAMVMVVMVNMVMVMVFIVMLTMISN